MYGFSVQAIFIQVFMGLRGATAMFADEFFCWSTLRHKSNCPCLQMIFCWSTVFCRWIFWSFLVRGLHQLLGGNMTWLQPSKTTVNVTLTNKNIVIWDSYFIIHGTIFVIDYVPGSFLAWLTEQTHCWGVCQPFLCCCLTILSKHSITIYSMILIINIFIGSWWQATLNIIWLARPPYILYRGLLSLRRFWRCEAGMAVTYGCSTLLPAPQKPCTHVQAVSSCLWWEPHPPFSFKHIYALDLSRVLVNSKQ